MIDRLIGGANDAEAGEEENTQATMANVEEMIEGYEWASEDVFGRKTARGAAELIEARLLDELMALEKANIHSFLESDDRIGVVLKFMDEAITELDNMGSLVSSYKIHLNVGINLRRTLVIHLLLLGRRGRHLAHPVSESWFTGSNSEPEISSCRDRKSHG